MALNYQSDARVQVRFTVTDDTVPNDPGYTDALYFTQAEFSALTGPQIRVLAISRYQAWRDAPVPPAPPPRTPKQRRDEATAMLRDTVNAISNRLSDLDSIPLE